MGLVILFLFAAELIVAAGSLAIIHELTHPPRLTFAAALGRRLAISPGELGLRFVDRTLRLSDGRRTPAWIIEGADPGGPVVVVTHAWGDSRYATLPLAPILAPHAAAVVLYDLRGHGESEPRKHALGTTEVEDLLVILTQLRGELLGEALSGSGASPDAPSWALQCPRLSDASPSEPPSPPHFVLMGCSIGAGISLAVAARAGDAVAGVILDGVYRWGMEPVAGYFRLRGWPLWPFYLPVGGHLAFWHMRDREFDRARHAAAVACPVLALHGTADPICRFASAEEVTAAAPRGELVAFEDGGHLTLDASRPDRYRAALASFFAGLRSSEHTAVTYPTQGLTA